jgi:hypothetical protein
MHKPRRHAHGVVQGAVAVPIPGCLAVFLSGRCAAWVASEIRYDKFSSKHALERNFPIVVRKLKRN